MKEVNLIKTEKCRKRTCIYLGGGFYEHELVIYYKYSHVEMFKWNVDKVCDGSWHKIWVSDREHDSCPDYPIVEGEIYDIDTLEDGFVLETDKYGCYVFYKITLEDKLKDIKDKMEKEMRLRFERSVYDVFHSPRVEFPAENGMKFKERYGVRI